MSDEQPAPDARPPRDKPDIRVVPPKIAAVFLVAGIVLNVAVRLHPFAFWTAFFTGLILLMAGAALVFWALDTFSFRGTNVRIDRPATALVTTGILEQASDAERAKLFAGHGATPDFLLRTFAW